MTGEDKASGGEEGSRKRDECGSCHVGGHFDLDQLMMDEESFKRSMTGSESVRCVDKNALINRFEIRIKVLNRYVSLARFWTSR